MSDEIFKAIKQHDARQVAALLSQGADPNARSTQPPQWRPLDCVIEETDHGGPQEVILEIMRLLIQHGADVNAWADDKHCYNPLLAAVTWKNREAVKLLLEAGADPNVFNCFSESPLAGAVEEDDLEMAALLLRHGANKTIDMPAGITGFTPLGRAASNLSLPMIELLLEAGADPEALDVDQQTARDYLPERDKSDPEVWDAALELLALQSA